MALGHRGDVLLEDALDIADMMEWSGRVMPRSKWVEGQADGNGLASLNFQGRHGGPSRQGRGAVRELKIVLKIRDEQARRAVKAQVDGMARVEAAAARAAASQDKASRRALLAAQKAGGLPEGHG